MRTMLFGVVMALAMISITALALATPAQKTLTQVTVSVQGLHCQGCIDELQQDLAKMPGVSAVKVTLQPAQATAKLDEATCSASQLVAAIARHPQMMNHAKTYGAHLVLFVDCPCCAKQTKMCSACFTAIPKALKSVKGIGSVSLDASGKVVSVTFSKNAHVTTHALVKALSASSLKFTTGFVAPKATAPPASNTGCGCGNGCNGGCGCGCK